MDYAYFAQIMSLKYHIHITVPHILIDLDPSLRLFLSRSQCSLVKFFNIEGQSAYYAKTISHLAPLVIIDIRG